MNFPHILPPLEMWGGLECTVNRVGDTYFDQLERNGHASRISDLRLFAESGIRKIRYPVQWERIAPHGLTQANWSWVDERLPVMHELGMQPIVGLTHHGSGPRYTSLIEPSFAEGLRQFADAVARRYPWIQYYNPVNEPLTTARFSGLYGHWYPHGHDQATMVQVLLTECRAVVLAMQAIREVNPAAQLIQSEDLGKAFSTPTLSEQANFENERRWLTFDLLCGRVNRDHALWNFLVASGAYEADLEWFLEHPCPPDVLGIDYYVTSERFMDECLDRYPVHTHSNNGRQRYADVEAVRVNTGNPLPLGYYERLKEAWERYHLPVAITEAHLGCTREEQLRWLMGAWNDAQRLREEDVDVRGVTAWSLLGNYEWNTLVTRITNFYEPGVFDVRGSHPRPTAIAHLIRTLADGKSPEHPVLAQPGWWKRAERFFYQASIERPFSFTTRQLPYEPTQDERSILIIEGKGQLGKAFARLCDIRGLPCQLVTQREIDMSNALAVQTMFERFKPWAVLYLVGSDCAEGEMLHDEVEDCRQTHASGILANACRQRGISLVAISSDLVFDGTQLTPYLESDPTTPASASGQMLVEMEEQILRCCPSALVIRTGPLFSPWENFNFERTLHLVSEHPASTMSQTVVSPTYTPDMVHACLDLLIDGEQGRWHLANSGAISWANLARKLGHLDSRRTANATGRTEEAATHGPHLVSTPIVSRALDSERGQLLPSLDDALTRYLAEYSREQEQSVAS